MSKNLPCSSDALRFRADCDLNEMRPRKQNRVIDLVRLAGVDVRDWTNCAGGESNAASNPRHCYNWAFHDVEHDIVVLMLWFRNTELESGKCFQEHNFRDLAQRQSKSRRSRFKRANEMDLAIRAAWKKGLEVRVVVLEGKMSSKDGVERSVVKKRLLDPRPWRVTFYDNATGDCRLERDPASP